MSSTRIRRIRFGAGRGEDGYTLTELAVVMSVFMIFMSFAAPVMFSQLNAAIRTERRVDVQQSARAALRTMVREMRQAKALYSSTDKPSGKNEISFGSDLNADGVVNDYSTSTLLEQITYYVQGGTLYRGRKKGQGVPLAEGVTNLTFTMYGSNMAFDTQAPFGVVTEDELNPDGAWTTAELTNVTRVVVSMTVTKKNVSQTYTADVFLRNKVVG